MNTYEARVIAKTVHSLCAREPYDISVIDALGQPMTGSSRDGWVSINYKGETARTYSDQPFLSLITAFAGELDTADLDVADRIRNSLTAFQDEIIQPYRIELSPSLRDVSVESIRFLYAADEIDMCVLGVSMRIVLPKDDEIAPYVRKYLEA